ncbi:hypothetical protein FA15DRAFT_705060 [Coprinopsis marcescibilis]|uniref:Fungal-type protein kinase domain-containing protein n=1 Tax=Coprinopsis marcescibilis TaxID=230819 RepID=A0A5C3KTJ5_COPMA|nr:hypothetical protein FA15DRAFT_705060 [Coprinopsis marcescibilis]
MRKGQKLPIGNQQHQVIVRHLSEVELFKTVWLDCLKCHYHAWKERHVLYKNIDEDSFMFSLKSGPKMRLEVKWVFGVLSDWSMAGCVDSSESFTLSPCGLPVFTAYELLPVFKPTNHQKYLHDLESFLYILVWVTVHYEPKTWTRRDTPRSLTTWNLGVPEEVAEWKMKMFFCDFKTVEAEIREGFGCILESWIRPLLCLFTISNLPQPTIDGEIEQQYDLIDTFMAAIGEKSWLGRCILLAYIDCYFHQSQ